LTSKKLYKFTGEESHTKLFLTASVYMSLVNNLGKITLILALSVSLTTPSFANAVADNIYTSEESNLLNEKTLNSTGITKNI
jgi:hypothetical protein